MKKTYRLEMFIFLLTVSCSISSNAQNLKDALNNLSNALQSKEVSKALNNIDTASVNKILGSFSKAAAQSPGDTSAADLTMKALGILTGGGGVSAADSATAIASFRSANGGNGLFIQYITTMNIKQAGTTRDTMTSYLTKDGEGRTEMNLIGMMDAKGALMIGLARINEPRYILMINPENKTYTLNVIDTSLINSTKKTYEVTKVGSETVSGYSCIHSKLKETTGSSIFKSTSEMDLWTCTDVMGYELLKKSMTIQNLTPDMFRALDRAGCAGFIVKMTTQSKDASFEMTLLHAENKDLPASLFKIPDGYAQSNSNTIIGNLVSSSPK